MLIQSVLSVAGSRRVEVGAVLLGAGGGCDELIRSGVGVVWETWGGGCFLCVWYYSTRLCHYYSRYNVASIQARVAYECKGSGNLQRG